MEDLICFLATVRTLKDAKNYHFQSNMWKMCSRAFLFLVVDFFTLKQKSDHWKSATKHLIAKLWCLIMSKNILLTNTVQWLDHGITKEILHIWKMKVENVSQLLN